MEDRSNIVKWLAVICIIIVSWASLFLLMGRFWGENGLRELWAIMLIGSAIIAFYTTLAFPGSIDEHGIIRESRIRLAVMSALLMTYLVYFGSVVYLDVEQHIETFAKEVLPTLTQLLAITISFYFGSTAAIEILKGSGKKDGSKTKG